MKPLIKWAGGKSREIKHIEQLIPKKFDLYVEPFFGGGAIFFSLKPKKAIINDLSEDLMNFYRYIKGEKNIEEFKREIYLYVEKWEKVEKFVKLLQAELLFLYNKFKNDEITKDFLKFEIIKSLNKKIDQFNGFFKNSFCVDSKKLFNEILKNIFSKLIRIRNIEIHGKRNFSREEMLNHILTAFRSGFYTHFRHISNDYKMGQSNISEEKYMAIYYFIKEFCYGSMFRFNEEGEFNIPYGGAVYNKKNFRKKVDNLFSNKTKGLFIGTTIYNLDFEELFKKIKLTRKDFVFLDPPYDTEFSEYDQNPFNKEDQERLANLLLSLRAKFILIIKNKSSILKLYKNKPKIKIKSFNKKYTYNVRGRNTRKTRHLIIYNF